MVFFFSDLSHYGWLNQYLFLAFQNPSRESHSHKRISQEVFSQSPDFQETEHRYKRRKKTSQPSSIEFLLIRNPPGHKLREIAADLSSKVGTRRDRYPQKQTSLSTGRKGCPIQCPKQGPLSSVPTLFILLSEFSVAITHMVITRNLFRAVFFFYPFFPSFSWMTGWL